MSQSVNKDRFIEILADRAGFTKGDVRIILDTLVEVFEDAVQNETEINVRGFGRLSFSVLPARKGYDGFKGKSIDLPQTRRVLFSLAENIRFANQRKD